ncbi:MAG: aspartate/glutamate racemase family protein [Sneathiella sp.]
MATQFSPFLGILMLDTAFPRILGDAGNIKSYDCPARLKIIKGAGSMEIVKDGEPAEDIALAFCKAAQALEAEGATAIVSTCGFLISVQEQIANSVSIPVMVSSLSLYPVIRSVTANGKIGILTASKTALGSGALKAAGINPSDVTIAGLEDCVVFSNAILTEKQNQPAKMDTAAIEKYAIHKSRELVDNDPKISAILLECGNLPPYTAAIAKATGLPVFSILDGAKLIWKKNGYLHPNC